MAAPRQMLLSGSRIRTFRESVGTGPKVPGVAKAIFSPLTHSPIASIASIDPFVTKEETRELQMQTASCEEEEMGDSEAGETSSMAESSAAGSFSSISLLLCRWWPLYDGLFFRL